MYLYNNIFFQKINLKCNFFLVYRIGGSNIFLQKNRVMWQNSILLLDVIVKNFFKFLIVIYYYY
jgi:hypothetical protein